MFSAARSPPPPLRRIPRSIYRYLFNDPASGCEIRNIVHDLYVICVHIANVHTHTQINSVLVVATPFPVARKVREKYLSHTPRYSLFRWFTTQLHNSLQLFHERTVPDSASWNESSSGATTNAKKLKQSTQTDFF